MIKPGPKVFVVDGVEVSLLRDARGMYWECSTCDGDCVHKLEAAVWVTLESWEQEHEDQRSLN